MRRLLGGLMVVVMVALGLVACGDDDDDGGGTAATEQSSSSAEENTVAVTAKGFAFDPTSAKAEAGEVYFSITNEDDTKHTFTIDGTDVDISLDPKGTGTAEADLDAGTYEWHCTIHSSMTGTLTVS
jgi:plastocyanin